MRWHRDAHGQRTRPHRARRSRVRLPIAGFGDEGESGVFEVVHRPRTRGECVDGPRPCPWVSCRHHLYLEYMPPPRQPGQPAPVGPGALKVNFPDRDPGELGESCSLDVAERGGITLEEVGKLMSVTRERVRQIEVRVMKRLVQDEDVEDLRDEMLGRARDEGAEAASRARRLA